MENGGLISKSALQKKLGKEDFKKQSDGYDGIGTLPPGHNSLYKPGGITLDEMAGRLRQEPNYPEDYDANMLASDIMRASRSAQSLAAAEKSQMTDWKQHAAFDKDAKIKERGERQLTGWDVSKGDTVQVGTEEMKVTHVSNDGMKFTLEDGKKYGTRVIEDGDYVYGKLKENPVAEPAKIAKAVSDEVAGSKPKTGTGKGAAGALPSGAADAAAREGRGDAGSPPREAAGAADKGGELTAAKESQLEQEKANRGKPDTFRTWGEYDAWIAGKSDSFLLDALQRQAENVSIRIEEEMIGVRPMLGDDSLRMNRINIATVYREAFKRGLDVPKAPALELYAGIQVGAKRLASAAIEQAKPSAPAKPAKPPLASAEPAEPISETPPADWTGDERKAYTKGVRAVATLKDIAPAEIRRMTGRGKKLVENAAIAIRDAAEKIGIDLPKRGTWFDAQADLDAALTFEKSLRELIAERNPSPAEPSAPKAAPAAREVTLDDGRTVLVTGAARKLLSRPPHRKRSERGRASGSEGV